MAKGKTKERANNDPIGRHLMDAVERAFTQAMEERKGMPLTAEEKKQISNGIEIIDPDEDIDKYKFNLINKLVSSGMTLKEAERQAKEEAKVIPLTPNDMHHKT